MEGKCHFSIAGLMTVVLIVAIDFALHRVHSAAYLILPLLSMLLLGLPKLRRGHPAQPFWMGFEAVGWPMVGLSLLLYQCYLRYDDLEFLAYPLIWLGRSGIISKYGDACGYACALIIYGAPQLLAAAIAGWLSARYRVVIERRPQAAEHRHPGPSSRSPMLRAVQALGVDTDSEAGR